MACGEIGGYVDDEDLDIGLQPVSDSGWFGTVDIDDDDDVQIDVHVFQPAN